jgi:hypothetical protein
VKHLSFHSRGNQEGSLQQFKMSFFSWLGLKAQKPQQSSQPCDPPKPPDTPNSMSIIDNKETTEVEKMTLINNTSRDVVLQIITTHASLLKLPDLKPLEEINSLLGGRSGMYNTSISRT